MGKIFCLIGKSGSGKDTLAKLLLQDKELDLQSVVPYTTRPMRDGEVRGVDYHFVSDTYMVEHRSSVIEVRGYETVNGQWIYCTMDDGQIWIDSLNWYLMIATPESFKSLKGYFGEDIVVPLYIEVDDGIRLSRALGRERKSFRPNYCEMCRRFIADDKDFHTMILDRLGIKERYPNIHTADCYLHLRTDILADIKRAKELSGTTPSLQPREV